MSKEVEIYIDKGKQVVKGESSGMFNKFWGVKKANVEIIDMEQQFERFNKAFEKIKYGKVYGKCRKEVNKEFKYSRERRVSCTDGNQQVSFNLVDRMDGYYFFPGKGKSWFTGGEVRYGKKIEYVHLGGIMIAVKGMQKSSPGAKTFVALFDKRFVGAEQGVIGTYEIDMSTTNGAIIYFCPNFAMDPQEFTNNIKVGIKTRGYQLQRGVENLIIRTGFVGNLCAESPSPECKMTQEKMGKMLAGKGIKAVPGREYTALEWNLETFFDQQEAAP